MPFKVLDFLKTRSSQNTFLRKFTLANTYDVALPAGTAVSLAWPTGGRAAVFGYQTGKDYLVSGSSVAPITNTTFEANGIEVNPPGVWWDDPGESAELIFMCVQGGILSVAVYV